MITIEHIKPVFYYEMGINIRHSDNSSITNILYNYDSDIHSLIRCSSNSNQYEFIETMTIYVYTKLITHYIL